MIPQPDFDDLEPIDSGGNIGLCTSKTPDQTFFPDHQNNITKNISFKDDDIKPSLPIVGNYNFPWRISCETLSRLLQDDFPIRFDHVKVIDCRFDYEFKYGHIVGAENLIAMNQMCKYFIKYSGTNTCFIFHCELSETRSFKWIQLFREYDRSRLKTSSQKLTFPEVYLLDGGYKQFYRLYKDTKLITGGYLPMKCDTSIGKSHMKQSQRLYDQQTRKALMQCRTSSNSPFLSMNRQNCIRSSSLAFTRQHQINISFNGLQRCQTPEETIRSEVLKTSTSLSSGMFPTMVGENSLAVSNSQPLPFMSQS